jgi:circadian clock protein KaiB
LDAFDEKADPYRLLLFVSGATPRSMRAVATVRKLCETSLVGRCELKVVDVFRDPLLARDYQIVALPTLLKLAPNPRRLFVGEMSDIAPLIAGLGLAA